MKHHRRLVVLSSLALASGALFFACSDSGGGFDAGPDSGGGDAKADTTLKDSSSSDGPSFGDGNTTDGNATDGNATDGNATDGSDEAAADAASDAIDETAADADDGSSDGAIADAGSVSTFMVVRAGGALDAGSDASLTNAAQPVFLEERNISDGALVRTIAMPTTVSGSNQPLTLSGTATSEGALMTSADGKYVVLAGFATGPGLASVASTSSVDGGTLRVIARVDHAGNVDTSTELAAFSGSDIRGAATSDGTAFWASGNASQNDSGLGGVQYAVLGSTGATTNITNAPYNTRVVGVFGGQLYVSSQLTPFNGISAVGTNLPTTTGQTAALLAGFAGNAGGPCGFSILDLDGSVAGLDVLYVADESSQANGGGIQKWVFDGSTWSKIATFTNGTSTGFRGVMAVPDGANVIVLGTTSGTSANLVLKYVDDGVNTAPTGAVLATAPGGTIFRGIALAPQ